MMKKNILKNIKKILKNLNNNYIKLIIIYVNVIKQMKNKKFVLV